MIKRVMVIAGSAKQFKEIAAGMLDGHPRGGSLNRSKCHLILDDENRQEIHYRFIPGDIFLKGLDDYEVERWGTWLKRADLKEIEAEIQFRQRRRPNASMLTEGKKTE